jgi:SET domain-containing protein
MKPYRPLPNCVTITTSKIEGLGLHAVKFIPKYTSLGISHVKNESFEQGMIRTPLGGFVNHSETPNCAFCDDGTTYTLVTIEDITPGCELTTKYHLYTPLK